MPNRFCNASKILTTSFQDLYICPLEHQVSVHSLFCTNTNSTSEDRFVTISVHDASSNTEIFLGKNLPVPANSTLSFDKAINLEEGDILKLKADAVITDYWNH